MKLSFAEELSKEEKNGVWSILCECDQEFYPPLSSRESSVQQGLNISDTNRSSGQKPVTYFKEMISQNFILVWAGKEMIAFMTFRDGYMCEALKPLGESLYVTTVCVKHSHRGRGILDKLYSCLECEMTWKYQCPNVSTRTWSLNERHIHALDKRDYHRIAVLPNDRGNGIDTIYFGKTMGSGGIVLDQVAIG